MVAQTHVIPAGRCWDDAWALQEDLPVEIRTTSEATLATPNSTVHEYGADNTIEEAIFDLLTSLSDYRESLEGREDRLGAGPARDLAALRRLIRRTSNVYSKAG